MSEIWLICREKQRVQYYLRIKPGPLELEPCMVVRNLNPEFSSLSAAPPPDGGFGDLTLFLGFAFISLLAGHVGNMDGSTGRGPSLNHLCSSASAAVIRLAGS